MLRQTNYRKLLAEGLLKASRVSCFIQTAITIALWNHALIATVMIVRACHCQNYHQIKLTILPHGKYVNQLKRIFMYFLSKADSFNLV